MKPEQPLAINGYDPVAYFIENRPLEGKNEHRYDWNGMSWRFASQANRDTFAADPGKYAPQYGGHCSFAMSLGKANAPAGSPKSWKIVDGRLYLALNPVAKFLMGILPGRIEKADDYWSRFPKQAAV